MLHRRLIIDGVEYKFAASLYGNGPPTAETEGCIGVTYMDETCGTLYKCTSASDGACKWECMESDTVEMQRQIDILAAAVADLQYTPIKINSISNDAGTVEMGCTINSLTITWALNKAPVSQTVNGAAVAASARSENLTGLGLTADKSYTVKATDERGTVATASTTVSFLNGVYYGVLTNGATIDSKAILSLTRKLQSSKALTFAANAGVSQQIAYAIPARYGTPTFNVGGFDGGFYHAASVAFRNASGYIETYDVWLTDHTGLGTTTVKVT